MYAIRSYYANYGTATPPQDANGLSEVFKSTSPNLAGRRFVLFLSRIHEKKGCDLLIQAFAKAAAQDPELHLAIAGPDQVGLKATLQVLAESLGVAHVITSYSIHYTKLYDLLDLGVAQASANRASMLSGGDDFIGVRRSLQTAFAFTLCLSVVILMLASTVGQLIDWPHLLDLSNINQNQSKTVILIT